MQHVSFIKKFAVLLLTVFFSACNNSEPRPAGTPKDDSTITEKDDTTVNRDSLSTQAGTAKTNDATSSETTTIPKTYSNQRFKEVTIKKTGEHSFLVKGKGQIFEASFSWVIEDGHEELQQGHAMTDAGAPEWGNFSFTVNAV